MTKHWRDLWDEHSESERQAMRQLPVSDLLERVKNGRFGQYYNAWAVIGEKGDLQSAGWILFDTLNQEGLDSLHAYHCADALLKLLRDIDLKPVDLSVPTSDLSDNLERIRGILEARVGPRG